MKLADIFRKVANEMAAQSSLITLSSFSNVQEFFSYIASFKWSQREKSHGFKSGEYSGNCILFLWSNVNLKQLYNYQNIPLKSSAVQWGPTPSCMSQFVINDLTKVFSVDKNHVKFEGIILKSLYHANKKV